MPAALAALLAIVAIGVTGMLDEGFVLLVPVLVMVVLVLPTAAATIWASSTG